MHGAQNFAPQLKNKQERDEHANSGKKQLPRLQDPRKSSLVSTKRDGVYERRPTKNLSFKKRRENKNKKILNMTYSSSLAMNRTRYTGRNQNSVSFKATSAAMGPVSNTIILIVLACLLGLLYLTQVTKTNAFGYQINSLSQQHTELKNKHDNLEVESARLQSVSRVESSGVAKSMVSVAPTATVRN